MRYVTGRVGAYRGDPAPVADYVLVENGVARLRELPAYEAEAELRRLVRRDVLLTRLLEVLDFKQQPSDLWEFVDALEHECEESGPVLNGNEATQVRSIIAEMLQA